MVNNFSTRNFIVGDELFEKYSGLDIFNAFIPNLQVGKLFCSQLRNDNNPTCTVFQANNGYYLYKDFGNNTLLGPINYVKALTGIGYNEALILIKEKLKDKTPVILPEKRNITMMVKRLPRIDMSYWNQYYITEETLNKFNVSSISDYYVFEGEKFTHFRVKKCYAYWFRPYVYKILNLNSNYKWLGNSTVDDVEGLHQCKPSDNNKIVITKSLKDVMVLHQHGISAISPSSENAPLPVNIMNKLKKFNVTILFDNDEAGRKGAYHYEELGRLVFLDNEKDISDFQKEYGEEETMKWIESNL